MIDETPKEVQEIHIVLRSHDDAAVTLPYVLPWCVWLLYCTCVVWL